MRLSSKTVLAQVNPRELGQGYLVLLPYRAGLEPGKTTGTSTKSPPKQSSRYLEGVLSRKLHVPVRLLVLHHGGLRVVVQLPGRLLVGVHPGELLSHVVCRNVSHLWVVRQADTLVTHLIRSCTNQGMATPHFRKDLE